MLKSARKAKIVGRNKWKELVRYSPEELHGTQIDLVNLICALGLPGSESLDIRHCQETLNKWAVWVKREIKRNEHNYERDCRKEPCTRDQWRIMMMVTALQLDLGVRYNPEIAGDNNFDFFDSRDVFIHGMIPSGQTPAPGGTCSSMPILYCAIARRLGFPLKLAAALGHMTTAWVAPQRGFQFYADGASRGCHIYPDDEHYTSSKPKGKAEFLFSPPIEHIPVPRPEILTPERELASMLATRGHVLVDNLRCEEASEAYQAAAAIDPRYAHFLRLAEALCGRPASLRWEMEADHKLKQLQSAKNPKQKELRRV